MVPIRRSKGYTRTSRPYHRGNRQQRGVHSVLPTSVGQSRARDESCKQHGKCFAIRPSGGRPLRSLGVKDCSSSTITNQFKHQPGIDWPRIGKRCWITNSWESGRNNHWSYIKYSKWTFIVIGTVDNHYLWCWGCERRRRKRHRHTFFDPSAV